MQTYKFNGSQEHKKTTSHNAFRGRAKVKTV